MTTSLPNLDLALERICKNLKRLYLEKNSQDFNKNQKNIKLLMEEDVHGLMATTQMTL